MNCIPRRGYHEWPEIGSFFLPGDLRLSDEDDWTMRKTGIKRIRLWDTPSVSTVSRTPTGGFG